MPAAVQQQKQNGPRATPPNLKPQASPISAISNRYKNAVLSVRVFDVFGSEKCLT